MAHAHTAHSPLEAWPAAGKRTAAGRVAGSPGWRAPRRQRSTRRRSLRTPGKPQRQQRRRCLRPVLHLQRCPPAGWLRLPLGRQRDRPPQRRAPPSDPGCCLRLRGVPPAYGPRLAMLPRSGPLQPFCQLGIRCAHPSSLIAPRRMRRACQLTMRRRAQLRSGCREAMRPLTAMPHSRAVMRTLSRRWGMAGGAGAPDAPGSPAASPAALPA